VTIKGETVAGIIHEPVQGDTLVATKGAGSFLHWVGAEPQRLQVAAALPLGEMVGSIAFSHMPEPMRSRIAANMAKTKMSFNYNCSAYGYWMASSGKFHFIGHLKLMPWIIWPACCCTRRRAATRRSSTARRTDRAKPAAASFRRQVARAGR
jgi:fructose-1,6-bisphosphatase/inositol monophosphatase family enzyme